MRILLVNDDGYNQTGIRILYKHLQKYGEVTLLAPEHHYSGASASFTLGRYQELKKYEDGTYSFDGTPVDCVLFGACSGLFPKFDLVISGCNNGLNLSYDVIYSGTLGATHEALLHDLPAIAFSTDFDHFDIVDKYFDEVFEYILSKDIISKDYILNVNFPRKQFDTIKGIVPASLFIKKDKYFYDVKDNTYFVDRIEDFSKAPEASDAYYATNGYVSITPLAVNSYNEKNLEILKSKLEK